MNERESYQHIRGRHVRDGTLSGSPPVLHIKGRGSVPAVHYVGILVDLQRTPVSLLMLLDDGTGRTAVHCQEHMFAALPPVGAVIRVLGKICQHEERYILADVVSVLKSPHWIDYHALQCRYIERLELGGVSDPLTSPIFDDSERTQPPYGTQRHGFSRDANAHNHDALAGIPEESLTSQTGESLEDFTALGTIHGDVPPSKPVVSSAQKDSEPSTQAPSPKAHLISLIKALDAGEGADFDEVLDHFGDPGGETHLKALLARGDVFEVRPGRLKVID